MGAKISKRYSSLKSFLNRFKIFFLKFLLSGPHKKYCFGFLKFRVFDFSRLFFVFVNMGLYRSQNFNENATPPANHV